MGFRRSLVAGALGAALAYFLDPVSGRRRRNVSLDRAAGAARALWRRGQRVERRVAAEAYGVVKKVEHRKEVPKDFDDATLAEKVQSEVFRDPAIPKGDLNVNVQEGVVQLRGEVSTPQMLEDLVRRTRKVQGVRDVESLLHLPGAPARMHE